jgi:hypothetical protein
VAATTTLTVTERAPGVVRGKRCVAPPRHPHGRVRHCNRTVVLGSLNHRDVAGTNRLRFTGRLGRHLLGPGRYGLQAVARLAGVASRPVGATFVVIS